MYRQLLRLILVAGMCVCMLAACSSTTSLRKNSPEEHTESFVKNLFANPW